MTEAYAKHDWVPGEIISEERLDAMEDGIAKATAGVIALEKATASASSLDAGKPATATFNGKSWTFGIPKGAAGTNGTNGTNGSPGAAGKQGSSLRVSAAALADDKADISATALSPNHAALPYQKGDLVLDVTTKKLYQITAVTAAGVATIGKALATLP